MSLDRNVLNDLTETNKDSVINWIRKIRWLKNRMISGNYGK